MDRLCAHLAQPGQTHTISGYQLPGRVRWTLVGGQLAFGH